MGVVEGCWERNEEAGLKAELEKSHKKTLIILITSLPKLFGNMQLILFYHGLWVLGNPHVHQGVFAQQGTISFANCFQMTWTFS